MSFLMGLQGYSSSEDELLENSEAISVVSKPDLVSHLGPNATDVQFATNIAGSYKKVYDSTVKRRQDTLKQQKQQRKKRRNKGDFESEYLGPWAGYSDDDDEEEAEEASGIDALEEGVHKNVTHDVDNTLVALPETLSTEPFTDNLAYMESPKKFPNKGSKFEAPKKIIYKHLDAHIGGVTRLRLFPNTGHLLLSSGNDANIYLWEVFNTKKRLRGYYGHLLAVKDICFNSSGSQFLSCSFDKTIVLWDTSTGDILGKVRLNSVPNVAIFNPKNVNEFIVGLANHKIEHYRINEDSYFIELIQSYTHHLGPINSLVPVDYGKRFMSTADDKSVRFWDWNVDNPVKVIADPSLYLVPTAAISPQANLIALQSMDGVIKIMLGTGKFKSTNRMLSGHSVAGYGIEVAFSGDDSCLLSGDSRGSVYCWNSKTCRIASVVKADSRPLQTIQVHPLERSLIFVGGTNGNIYVLL